MKKILIEIYIYSANTKNGGNAQSLDMANTLLKMGFLVKVISLQSITRTIFRRKMAQAWVVRAKKIENHNGIIRSAIYAGERLYSTLIDCFLFNNYERKVVIDTTSLPASYISKMRRKDIDMTLIFSHFGPVSVFKDDWLVKKKPMLGLSGSNATIYEKFIARYDGIFFEAEDQLVEARKFILDKNIEFHLVPSGLSQYSKSNLKVKAYKEKTHKKIVQFVMVGSVQVRKNQLDMIKAFSCLMKVNSNVRLLIIGSIADKKYYQKIIKTQEYQHTKEKIIFMGHREDYYNFLSESDVFVQTSEAEGLSRSLREAMYIDLPVIAFAIVGTRWLLADVKGSYLIQPGNIEQLCKALQEVALLIGKDNLKNIKTKNRFNEVLSDDNYRNSLKKMIEFER